MNFIYIRKHLEGSEDIFLKNQILSIYDLQIYELLKFVLISINNFHLDSYLSEIFCFELKYLKPADLTKAICIKHLRVQR